MIKKPAILFLLILFLLASGFVYFIFRTLTLEKERKENFLVPKFPRILEVPRKGSFGATISSKDPSEGPAGDVKFSLDLEKTPPEVSWPKDYSLRSFKLYFLGNSEETFDNIIVQSFEVNIPPALDWERERFIYKERKLEPPFQLGSLRPEMSLLQPTLSELLNSPRGFRYAIEAYFQKEGEDKIYKGIYGFRY